MPDSNPGPLPQKSGALPMSHHIRIIECGIRTRFPSLPGDSKSFSLVRDAIFEPGTDEFDYFGLWQLAKVKLFLYT